MTWSAVLNLITIILAWSGAAFVALAALGVVRMPDVFSRMQASSKAATLGSACLALAVAFHFESGEVAIRAIVLIAFLFLTAPIAAHLVARVGYLTGVPIAEETSIDEAREHFEDEQARAEAARAASRSAGEDEAER